MVTCLVKLLSELLLNNSITGNMGMGSLNIYIKKYYIGHPYKLKLQKRKIK